MKLWIFWGTYCSLTPKKGLLQNRLCNIHMLSNLVIFKKKLFAKSLSEFLWMIIKNIVWDIIGNSSIYRFPKGNNYRFCTLQVAICRVLVKIGKKVMLIMLILYIMVVVVILIIMAILLIIMLLVILIIALSALSRVIMKYLLLARIGKKLISKIAWCFNKIWRKFKKVSKGRFVRKNSRLYISNNSYNNNNNSSSFSYNSSNCNYSNKYNCNSKYKNAYKIRICNNNNNNRFAITKKKAV